VLVEEEAEVDEEAWVEVEVAVEGWEVEVAVVVQEVEASRLGAEAHQAEVARVSLELVRGQMGI
jgi:hypothetical protein